MSDGQRDAARGLHYFLLGGSRPPGRAKQLVLRIVNNRHGEPTEPEDLTEEDLREARGSIGRK